MNRDEGKEEKLHKSFTSTPHVSAWSISRTGCFLIEESVLSK